MSARSMTVGPSPLRSRPTNAGLSHALRHLITGSTKAVRRNASRPGLVQGQFGISMQILVDGLQVGKQVAQFVSTAWGGFNFVSSMSESFRGDRVYNHLTCVIEAFVLEGE